MGIERAATRWYLQRVAYEREATSIEAKLDAIRGKEQRLESIERSEIEKQLAQVLTKLRRLGPCPKAMMG